MRLRKLLISVGVTFLVLIASFFSTKRNHARPFHTEQENSLFKKDFGQDPIDSNQYFLTSVRCKGCHGFDTLNLANIDANGTDINLYDDWETTMMANSAKDPLWRAKVSHEILVDPTHAAEIETKCTSCHAPMGHFTAMFHGESSYVIEDLENDTLGLNGVSCGGCHQIGTQNFGTTFSGDIFYDTSNVEYGPFEDPLLGPMQLYEGMTPMFSEHISKSQVCAPCHTLYVNTIDMNGNYTGNTFPEQATFHEWLNSSMPENNITCQTCHMPEVTDSVVIANNILALPPRSPFNQHQFAGGNYFMVNLIKQNKEALNITASDINFDSTLAATYRMLTQQSLDVGLMLDSISSDTAFLRFRITNKAGHKFPSGYPSRRAVVQVVMLNENLDTVFQSGIFDSNYEVKHLDAEAEPHYTIIRQKEQIQIYEMAFADVNNDFTTVLGRADHFLKDNRIPPEGFSTTFYAYDTAKIVGEALNDPDFNKNGVSEGSGRDFVHYHIPLSGFSGPVSVFAKVFYQAVPPRWVAEMFTFSSEEIDSFKTMYENSDRSPIVAASDSLINILIPTQSFNEPSINSLRLLNTINNGEVEIENPERIMINSIKIFDSEGKILSESFISRNAQSIPVQLPLPAGIFFLEIKTSTGSFLFKTVRVN